MNITVPNYSAFGITVGCMFGLRECSELVKIANDTHTIIELLVGNKRGSTNSIVSLLSLGIITNTHITFSITGQSQSKAYTRIKHLLDEGWTRKMFNKHANINDINHNLKDEEYNE